MKLFELLQIYSYYIDGSINEISDRCDAYLKINFPERLPKKKKMYLRV